MHAFVDESQRRGRYLITAVLVPTVDLQATTKRVRATFTAGNRRTHLSDESPARRRQYLRRYAGLGVDALTLVAKHERGSDQPAREQCLTVLVDLLVARGVMVLVLDSRGTQQDQRDRRCLTNHLVRAHDRDALTFAHRGSRDEPLLCLPDAVGWAVGAGEPWRAIVAAMVTVVQVP